MGNEADNDVADDEDDADADAAFDDGIFISGESGDDDCDSSRNVRRGKSSAFISAGAFSVNCGSFVALTFLSSVASTAGHEDAAPTDRGSSKCDMSILHIYIYI